MFTLFRDRFWIVAGSPLKFERGVLKTVGDIPSCSVVNSPFAVPVEENEYVPGAGLDVRVANVIVSSTRFEYHAC